MIKIIINNWLTKPINTINQNIPQQSTNEQETKIKTAIKNLLIQQLILSPFATTKEINFIFIPTKKEGDLITISLEFESISILKVKDYFQKISFEIAQILKKTLHKNQKIKVCLHLSHFFIFNDS